MSSPPSDPPPADDLDVLSAWLAASVADATPPFTFDLIAAGGSNLTYRLTDAVGSVRVLRRPPHGRALQSAHDMGREFRIMSALAPTPVPVPTCLAACDDPAVAGAPFYVMSFVDGRVLRTSADSVDLDAEAAATATRSLVETQVAMHTIDLDAVGLADLGRHDDYVRRQLRRWRRQVDAAKVRELPILDELHDRLVATVPPERAAPALAHGDHRFDNCVLAPDHSIAAVLDWELCTTGDPIADFAWSIRYWADPGDELTWLPDPPTVQPPFPSRASVVDLYASMSGFDLSDFGWYEVFSWWKHACIVEGVHARRRAGSRGGASGGSVDIIAARVDAMLTVAHELAKDRLP